MADDRTSTGWICTLLPFCSYALKIQPRPAESLNVVPAGAKGTSHKGNGSTDDGDKKILFLCH